MTSAIHQARWIRSGRTSFSRSSERAEPGETEGQAHDQEEHQADPEQDVPTSPMIRPAFALLRPPSPPCEASISRSTRLPI